MQCDPLESHACWSQVTRCNVTHAPCVRYMRDIGLINRIVPLLQHSNVKLLTRAVGVSCFEP